MPPPGSRRPRPRAAASGPRSRCRPRARRPRAAPARAPDPAPPRAIRARRCPGRRPRPGRRTDARRRGRPPRRAPSPGKRSRPPSPRIAPLPPPGARRGPSSRSARRAARRARRGRRAGGRPRRARARGCRPCPPPHRVSHSSPSAASLTLTPRALNDPVCCRLSALKRDRGAEQLVHSREAQHGRARARGLYDLARRRDPLGADLGRRAHLSPRPPARSACRAGRSRSPPAPARAAPRPPSARGGCR